MTSNWIPTHRHRKGGFYRFLYQGRLEWNLEEVIIYESHKGEVWVRSVAEFNDGRFTELTLQEQQQWQEKSK